MTTLEIILSVFSFISIVFWVMAIYGYKIQKKEDKEKEEPKLAGSQLTVTIDGKEIGHTSSVAFDTDLDKESIGWKINHYLPKPIYSNEESFETDYRDVGTMDELMYILRLQIDGEYFEEARIVQNEIDRRNR